MLARGPAIGRGLHRPRRRIRHSTCQKQAGQRSFPLLALPLIHGTWRVRCPPQAARQKGAVDGWHGIRNFAGSPFLCGFRPSPKILAQDLRYLQAACSLRLALLTVLSAPWQQGSAVLLTGNTIGLPSKEKLSRGHFLCPAAAADSSDEPLRTVHGKPAAADGTTRGVGRSCHAGFCRTNFVRNRIVSVLPDALGNIVFSKHVGRV
jgi:hypothetical protein